MSSIRLTSFVHQFDEESFEPTYEVLEGKEKVVSELRAAAKKASVV